MPADSLGVILLIASPLDWYTVRELTCQYASVKAPGLSCTNAWQLVDFDEHTESWPQTLPAQSPQKVMSKMMLCSRKCWSMSHPPSNLATGLPHPLGFGLPLETSPGITPLGKNQMLMASPVHSVAYTPPPFALKPVPYEAVSWEEIWHPAFANCPGA